ncbi:transposase [Mycobacterium bohemicum DSM 44277]|uniref:Transposase n=1 Tax=Mycobacterium bohemicum DSM 44277 TaxID=1236609 RepID=A0A0U0W4T3_MYCBE|nr:transposase [Mycobacterium bohemicum DSM 44277]
MKTRPAHRRRIADIVQPRRRHQTIGSLCIEMATKLLRCRHHAAHMRQPPRLPCQPRLSLAPSTLRQNPAHTRKPTSPSATAQLTADAATPSATSGEHAMRRLPAGFAPLPGLPSAGAPVRAGRYASPSVRRHTSPSTTSQSPHLKGPHDPGVPRQPRALLAPRRHSELPWAAGAQTLIHRPPTSGVRTFSTGIKRRDAVRARIEKALRELRKHNATITVSSVARRAGVTRKSIYRREDLLALIYAHRPVVAVPTTHHRRGPKPASWLRCGPADCQGHPDRRAQGRTA